MLLELDGFHGNRAHPLGNGFSGRSCLRVTGWAVPAPVGGVGPATLPAKLPSLPLRSPCATRTPAPTQTPSSRASTRQVQGAATYEMLPAPAHSVPVYKVETNPNSGPVWG